MIHSSPHPAVELSETPLAEFVLAGAAARGERPALVGAVTSDSISYSSGTMGLSKGVMLTDRDIVTNMLQVYGASHYVLGEATTAVFLPLFHIYGLTAIALLGLLSGATMVVMPKFELAPYLGPSKLLLTSTGVAGMLL